MGLHVEIITEFADFLKIESEWQDLVSRSHFNRFSVSHPWLALWWLSFGSDAVLQIATVSDGEKLVAAAPLQLGKSRFRGLPVKKLSFLTNSHVPHIDFLVDKALKDGYTILLNVISKIAGWNVFYLENIPASSPQWPEWPDFFAWNKLISGQKPGLNSPTLLIDHNFEEYYRSLSKKFRKVMRNKKNRLEKSGSVKIEEITREFDPQYVIDNLMRVSGKSWKARYGKDLLSDPSLTKFFTDLTTLTLEKNWLKLWFLKLDDQVIAFEYHLQYNGQDCALRADFDEDYRELHPGSYLDARIIQLLFEHGVTQYDMAGTDDFYKLNWTKDCINHLNGFIFRPSLYGRFLYFLEFSLIPFLRKNIFLRKLKNLSERFEMKSYKDPKRNGHN